MDGLTLTWAMCTIAQIKPTRRRTTLHDPASPRTKLGNSRSALSPTTYEILVKYCNPLLKLEAAGSLNHTATRLVIPLSAIHAIPEQEQCRYATPESHRTVDDSLVAASRETDHARGKGAGNRPLHRLSRRTSRGILRPTPLRPPTHYSEQDDIFVCRQ